MDQDYCLLADTGRHPRQRQRNADAQRRRKRAAGDDPLLHVTSSVGKMDRQAVAQYAFFGHHQPDQLLAVAGGALGLQRLASDEIALLRLPGDGLTHIGRERRDPLIHFLTVKVHPRFQPQGVARAQAAGLNAGRQQLPPEIGGLGCR